jgi:uncharacterized CHY-type Zn-finger protein
MAWPEKKYPEKCPLCGVVFETMTKKGGMAIELCSGGDHRFFRVCDECDIVYSMLNKIKWEKELNV